MSLTNSMYQPLIGMYQSEKLDKWEILFSRYGVWAAFLNETDRPGNIISPMNLKNLQNSWGNTVPIVVLEGDVVTIGNTYSCTIADQENTSAKITPTFTQLAWGFNQYPSQFGANLNYVPQQENFTHTAREYDLALMAEVDTLSRNVLELNKNTYWTTNIANYFATTGDALQISQAQKNDAFNQLTAVLKEMDLYETSLLISSTSINPLVTRLEAQGEGNAINERFQFMLGNFIWTSSNRIVNNTNVQSTFYAVQPGAIATFNRNNPDAKAHNKIGGGEQPVTEWGEMYHPRLGMVVGTYFTAGCVSSPSATSYMQQPLLATLKQSFGWNTEIGWLTPYNSSPTTKVTPIVKGEISNS